MATRAQLEQALLAAHKAGNADHARKLATAIKDMPAGEVAPGAPVNKLAQSTAAEPWKPYFNSKEEFEAAQAQQRTTDRKSVV